MFDFIAKYVRNLLPLHNANLQDACYMYKVKIIRANKEEVHCFILLSGVHIANEVS